MAKLVILGSSYAVPDETHENTHMAIVGQERTVLVDCVGNPIARLKEAGLDHNAVTDIIMTHFHPDHISGVPLLLMSMWLLERKHDLSLYGLEFTTERMQKLMDFYDWKSWPNFFPTEFHTIKDVDLYPVLETDEFKIYTSPVQHWVPTVGLRIEFVKSGKIVAYSSDTAPTETVYGLAKDADILIHEAAGASEGHSSAEQAGMIATEANAKELYLIHYPTGGFDYHSLIAEAAKTFKGPVKIAEDLDQFEFD